MDLDWAITFIIGTTALISGAAAVRSRAWRWLAVQIVNLAAVGLAWLFARGWVAAIAGPIWLVTVIAPSVATSWADRFARADRFGAALFLTRVAATLHPNAVTRLRVHAIAAQHAELTNDPAIMTAALARLASAPGGATLAKLLQLRFEQRWIDVRTWVEDAIGPRVHAEHAPLPDILAKDNLALSFYLRSLGELGDHDTLANVFAKSMGTPAYQAVEGQAMLFFAGFLGLEAATDAILAAHFDSMPDEGKRLWRATAARAAGKNVDAELDAIGAGKRLRIAAVARARKKTPLPERRSEDTEIFTERFNALALALEPSRAPPFFASATFAFTVLNVYVFAREIPGGTTNPDNLFALGALYTGPLTAGSAFRLVTAALLHAGTLHLVMNTLGLFALGTRLEASIGRVRFAIVYIAAGIGANALAIVATAVLHRDPQHVVGASGSVMGVAGALLVQRMLMWRKKRTPLARTEVLWLVALLGLQVVFDTLTPVVAGSVHLFGAGVGAIVALIMSVKPGRGRSIAKRSLRAYFAPAVGVAASVAALEILWAREGTTRPDERDCEYGDVAACGRTCDVLYGAEAMAQTPYVTPLKARVKGRIRGRLSRSCFQHAVRLNNSASNAIDDHLRAFAIFDDTCRAGHVQSCVQAGTMLEDGHYLSRNHHTAMELFTRGCDAGVPTGCRNLATGLLEDGEEEKGRALLVARCDAGDELSCTVVDNLK